MFRAGRAAAVLAAALALTACGGGAPSGGGQADGGVYRLGMVTSSTGPFAANHTTMVAGAEYAVKLLNDGGGINGSKVELITVDGQNNPASLATLIPQLVTRDQVYAMVGPVDSAGCEIACATANKLKVPIVSPGAGRPGVLANSRPYGFTLAQPDAANSTAVLSKVIRDKGFKTAAIITDDANATTKAQADLFTKIFADTGVQVVQRATFASGDSSFASQVTSIAGADPDILALAAGPDDAGRIAREARSQKLRATFLGTGALQSGGSAYVAAGGDATEGTIAAAQYDPHSASPEAAPLLEKAQAATKQPDIPLNFAYAFDAVNMIATLIKDKGLAPDGADIATARTQIQEGLNGIDEYTGMADVTTFAEDGTAERPQLRAVVQGGKFVIDKAAS
jgi:branched-chain amino acid transport system substrate-binding protein